MHEMAVTESILRITLDHAGRAHASRVSAITIKLGQLSSLVDDSIRFYWDLIAVDTIAEKAELRFERVPARALCLDCQTEFALPKDSFACPKCRSERFKIVAGDEMTVESIEIEPSTPTPDPFPFSRHMPGEGEGDRGKG
jgi:hydrogenase nickel incorporation protein HypA/HybF